MAITYRTTAAPYLGAGVPLTNLQIDENFYWLATNAGTGNSDDVIGVTNGGTGLSSCVAGDILYGSAPNTMSKLAKGTDGNILSLASGIPSWIVNNPVVESTTNASFYIPFTSATSGAFGNSNIASAKLYFNPSTGTLNSTIFNSLSDVRFKSNIRKVTSALDKVNSLSGYTYTLTESGTKSAGLLAQEVRAVLPEAIDGSEDRLTLNYQATIALLVEAIKDLTAQVQDLRVQLQNTSNTSKTTTVLLNN